MGVLIAEVLTIGPGNAPTPRKGKERREREDNQVGSRRGKVREVRKEVRREDNQDGSRKGKVREVCLSIRILRVAVTREFVTNVLR